MAAATSGRADCYTKIMFGTNVYHIKGSLPFDFGQNRIVNNMATAFTYTENFLTKGIFRTTVAVMQHVLGNENKRLMKKTLTD